MPHLPLSTEQAPRHPAPRLRTLGVWRFKDMETLSRRARDLLEGLLPPSRGAGPLLQRDYWAIIDGCRLTPSEVMEQVARRFAEFAPEQLVVFRREQEGEEPL